MPLGLNRNAYYNISVKTAAYQILPEDLGKIFTTRGATGSVTFTLPVPGDIQSGWNCRFFAATADQNLVIAAWNSGDTLTTFNDLTADTITVSTGSEIAGAGFECIWDGTGWLVYFSTEETQTITIA